MTDVTIDPAYHHQRHHKALFHRLQMRRHFTVAAMTGALAAAWPFITQMESVAVLAASVGLGLMAGQAVQTGRGHGAVARRAAEPSHTLDREDRRQDYPALYFNALAESHTNRAIVLTLSGIVLGATLAFGAIPATWWWLGGTAVSGGGAMWSAWGCNRALRARRNGAMAMTPAVKI